MIALALASLLWAAPARAAASTDVVDAEQLQQDADALQAMTDSEFLTNAGRAKAKVADMPTGGQSTGEAAGDDTPDSRLSRPRALAMVYDTLAAYEYNQAADSGLLPQPELIQTSAKLKAYRSRKSLLADPSTRKASAAYTRVSRKLSAKRASLQVAGRATGTKNKKLAALGARLAAVRKELANPATPVARKAALHAKAGRIYDDMSAAARYQASVSVVTASVLDADGNEITTNDSTDHPNSDKPAGKVARIASRPKSQKRVSDDVAPAPAPAAPDAAPAAAAPSEEDEVKAGEAEMNELGDEMHQQIQQRSNQK